MEVATGKVLEGQAGSVFDISFAEIDTLVAVQVDTVSAIAYLTMNDYLIHEGDADTYLGFDAADSFTMLVGNEEMVDITEDDSQDKIEIGDGDDHLPAVSPGVEGANGTTLVRI